MIICFSKDICFSIDTCLGGLSSAYDWINLGIFTVSYELRFSGFLVTVGGLLLVSLTAILARIGLDTSLLGSTLAVALTGFYSKEPTLFPLKPKGPACSDLESSLLFYELISDTLPSCLPRAFMIFFTILTLLMRCFS